MMKSDADGMDPGDVMWPPHSPEAAHFQNPSEPFSVGEGELVGVEVRPSIN